MSSFRFLPILSGALATALIALASTAVQGPALIADLTREAERARDTAGGKGIAVSFSTESGWLTRHAELDGGTGLPPSIRAATAIAIAELPGVGGAYWRHDDAFSSDPVVPRNCEEDVRTMLKVRSIRFQEGSVATDPASEGVLDEVATALRPCIGGLIEIVGHTDIAGDPVANQDVSQKRADAVRQALIRRGIPAEGLRARGVGADEPLPDLAPSDPANRRIEFNVLLTRPQQPTPIDTPGPD